MKDRYIETDRDRWYVKLGDHPPHPGVGTVLFFPRNNQRPYRVVEVPLGRFGSQEELERLSDDELLELYHGADMMDFAHESLAAPNHAARIAQPLPPDVGAGEP